MSEEQPPPTKGRARGRARSRARAGLVAGSNLVPATEETPTSPQRTAEEREEAGRVSPVGLMQGLTIRGGSPEADNGNGNGSNGNGNGNGNGSGNGNGNENGRRDDRHYRGTRLGVRRRVDDDQVVSRNGKSKKGTTGQPITLMANFFNFKKSDAWNLYQYHVDFEPQVDEVRVRKALLREHSNIYPAYIFDGGEFYVPQRLHDNMVEISSMSRDGTNYLIKLKLVAQLDPHDAMYIQFYNIMARKCLEAVGLVNVGRNHFDDKMAVQLPQHNLQIWPGFLTTIRQHDAGLLYCVQSLHKVLRNESVLEFMLAKRREVGNDRARAEAAVEAELVGSTVLTSYNNKSYRIDAVAWDKKPTDTFDRRGVDVTFLDYYRERYNRNVNPRQPLLVSNPTRQEIRRSGGTATPHLLIPELCNMTGLSETMRQNFGLMRDMGRFLFQPPQEKATTIGNFVERVRRSQTVVDELKHWGLQLIGRMIDCPGRQFPPQDIILKDKTRDQMVKFKANHQADFTAAFRGLYRMTATVDLKSWVCIVSQRDSQGIDNLFREMREVSRAMGFMISPPDIVRLQLANTDAYIHAITAAMDKYGPSLQMVMVILPNNKLELYSAIKKRCYVDFGISSQCFLAKNINSRGLKSIATKLTVQMNCKLGGEAWQVGIPLKNTMMVGFDVYHGGVGSKGASIGAMVASMNDTYGRYFSTVTVNKSREEITTNMATELLKCLKSYMKLHNGVLPGKIFFYRDGVGEGQLFAVYQDELEGLKAMIAKTYKDAEQEVAKLTFIVITKRINARIFKTDTNRASITNPDPGTIVDDVITMPDRYDFFLVAQTARQGTVTPTSYNVLFDEGDLPADRVQYLTYKLCHLYFNWTGTVAVPAPCQYAHKLAYLTGLATKDQTKESLSNYLYFL